MPPHDALQAAIAERRDDLVALTQALIRIPTVNPPGENYRAICELIADRLAASGFACDFVRAEGTPGDSDRYPRWNLVARREGARPGPCVHFNGHIDVVEVGHGWTIDPFGGELDRRPDLRPRHLRHEGRARRGDRRGRGVPRDRARTFPARSRSPATADEETGGYGGVAYLARARLLRADGSTTSSSPSR